MEPLPLLPEINSKACPDTTHVIREEFQELLQGESFPKKTAKNLRKYNVDGWELKKCGVEVDEVYDSSKIVQNHLGSAETRLIQSQAKYLVKRDEEGPLPNIKLTTMPRMFEDDEEIIKKYNLLQYDDILPNISERLLDYRFRMDRTWEPCPKLAAKLKRSKEFPFVKSHLPEHFDNLFGKPEIKKKGRCSVRKLQKPKPIHTKRFANLKEIDEVSQNKTDEEKMDEELQEMDNPITEFQAKPRVVFFFNFETNIQYERSLYVYNTTNKPQSVNLPELAQNSVYTIRLASQGSRIAPGMYCRFVIGFKTDSLNDVFEVMLIRTPNGQNIQVKIIAHRDPPLLKGLVHEPQSEPKRIITPDEITSHNEAHNYCIDCSSTLLGYCTEVGFKLRSYGIPGRYFIISEDDWEFSNIMDATDDLHLHLECFHIYPNYFELDVDDEIDLQIVFHPDSEGLHTEKVFVICDNNSTIELDLIGDCLIYKNNFFVFDFPKGPHRIEKTECDPEYSLHLGPTYYNQVSEIKFWIRNKSPLKMKYGWTKKPADVKNRKQVRNMKEDWIKITPLDGIFTKESETEFTVKVSMKSNRCGLYSYVLSLYVYDIPSISLSEGPIYEFDEEYFADGDPDSPELLSILVARVEVQIRNLAFPIYITPEEIKLGTILFEQRIVVDNVMVFNDGFDTVECHWIYLKECGCPGTKDCDVCCHLKFDKRRFHIERGNYVECKLMVCPSSYEDIDEIIQLSINNGYAYRQFRITAEIQKPLVTVLNHMFDFGYVRTLLEVKETILVYNKSRLPLKWAVFEYVYDNETREMQETDCYCHLTSDAGQLCHKGSYCQFQYTLDTSVPRIWLSILVFCTLHDNKRIESTHTIILADIREPKITITDENRSPWTLNTEDNLYMMIPKTFKVFIENDSMVMVPYKWGTPCGDDVQKIEVQLDEDSGSVPPLSRKEVEITLNPVEYGRVDDCFVPMEVEGLKETLYLRIKGFVQCLKVIISLPDDDDEFVLVHWPSEMLDGSFESFDIGEIGPESQPEEDLEGNKDYTILSTAKFIDNSPGSKNSSAIIGNVKEIDIPSLHMESVTEECTTITIFDLNTPEDPEHTPSVSTQRTTSLMSLLSFFGSEVTIHEHIVEYSAIPLGTPVKKTIYIENVTEISSEFQITCTNLDQNRSPPEEGVDSVLYKMKWKTKNEFAEKLTEHGIVVVSKPESGPIGSKETVSVDLWVYAETWGAYLEEIGITIGDMPTFYFNLLIEIVGIPLEYPICGNNTVEPILDFGYFCQMSDPERRILRYVNTSNIPICVVWQVFDETNRCCIPPFNVVYDVFGLPNQETGGDDTSIVIRLEKFLGDEHKGYSDQIFQVIPRETYVEPKQTGQVSIYFNPEETTKPNIRSYMVGHIYIQEKYRNLVGVYSRPPDLKLPMVKVQLSAMMVEPSFEVCYNDDSTQLTIPVNDAVKLNKCKAHTRIILRNLSKARIPITFMVKDPFEITRVRSLRSDEDYKTTDYKKCEIGHNECVEVFITCRLTSYFVSYVAKAVYNNLKILKNINILQNNMVEVNKSLRLYGNTYLIHEVPLSLTLPFPNMCTSSHYLEFEEVFIGSVKKKTLLLTNKITSSCWFRCCCVDQFYKESDSFRVEPNTGVLSPARPDVESLNLTVYYKPTVVKRSEEYLVIESCLKEYMLQINLYGTGTYDEKYFIPPLKNTRGATKCV